MAHGIDRRALLDDAGYGHLTVAEGFVGTFAKVATNRPWIRYMPDTDKSTRAAWRSRALVSSATVPQIHHSLSTRRHQTRTSGHGSRTRLAQQLTALGIEVELQLEDSQIFFGDTLEQGNWDVGNWAWVGSAGTAALVDMFDRFAPGEGPPDGSNYYNWGNPGSSVEADEAVVQFRDLLARMRNTVNADEVVSLARQLEQILADQVVIIPLNSRITIGAVWADEIQGFKMNPSIAGHTWNIEHWYRVGE